MEAPTIMLGPPERGGSTVLADDDVRELCLLEMFDFSVSKKVEQEISSMERQQQHIMAQLGHFLMTQRKSWEQLESKMKKDLAEHFAFVTQVANSHTESMTCGELFSVGSGAGSSVVHSDSNTLEEATPDSFSEINFRSSVPIPCEGLPRLPAAAYPARSAAELRNLTVEATRRSAASRNCSLHWRTSTSSVDPMEIRYSSGSTKSSERRLTSLDNVAPWRRDEYTNSLSPSVTDTDSSSDASVMYDATQQLQEAYTRYSNRVQLKGSTIEHGRGNTSRTRKRCFTMLASALVKSNFYEVLMLMAILLDAVFVALVTEYSISTATQVYDGRVDGVDASARMPSWGVSIEIAVNSFFLLELVLRFVTLRSAFFSGEGWRWNLFDTVVLVGSMGEITVIANVSNYEGNGAVRVLRMFRILRTVRMLRLVHYTPVLAGLQLMLIALANSSVALLWAVVMLSFVIVLFALIFVNAVASYLVHMTGSDADIETLREHFSSLPMTWLTLFMTMTGGVDWWVLAKAMIKIHPLYALLFVLFVLLMVVVVLNVITGIFVNDAVALARMDEDLRMQTELQQSRQLTDRLNTLFHNIDTSCNGEFTLNDLKTHLMRHEVTMLFTLLGIDVSDAVAFFNLLDVDGSGSVQIEEFVMGCLRLQGRSGMMNMEINIQETGRLVKTSNNLLKTLLDKANRIEQILEQMTPFRDDLSRCRSRNSSSSLMLPRQMCDSLKLDIVTEPRA